MRYFLSVLLIVFVAACDGQPTPPEVKAKSEIKTKVDKPRVAKNVILFIGDGMGLEQVKAAGLYKYGKPGTLLFEGWANTAKITTDSLTPNKPTDSASSASAYSTGRKYINGAVAYDANTKTPVKTIAERFKEDGRAVGIVTNDQIGQATPASFVAHVRSRNMYPQIAKQIIETAKPDVLIGAADKYYKADVVRAAGYLVAQTPAGLEDAASRAIKDDKPLAGLFPGVRFTYLHHDVGSEKPKYGSVYPTLPQITATALKVLEARGGEKGFFLMVEGALTDKSGHAMNTRGYIKGDRIACNIKEAITLEESVAVAVAWAKRHPDTLILVTADHETGGLVVVEPRGKGKPPKVTWAHKGHTRADVGAWAMGIGAEAVKGEMDNTELYGVMMKASGLEK